MPVLNAPENLTDCPAQIYNMDETGVPLDHRPPSVVAKRGQKKVRSRVAGKKEQIIYCYMFWECSWAVNSTYGYI